MGTSLVHDGSGGVQMEDLYKECITRQNQASRETHTLRLVPSLCEVEEVLRRMRPDRTGGPRSGSQLDGQRGRRAPAVFDLWMKTVLWAVDDATKGLGDMTRLSSGG